MLQVDAVMYHSPTKSMATEIPGSHASWEAPRNNYVTCIRPSSGCCVCNKSPKLPVISAREPKATSDVSGQKEAGLRAQHAVVKDLLTHEHILYHLIFAESSVGKQWNGHIH